MALGSGEVVYDSIIQNKSKTKSYWEQLMMAAATSDQQKVQYHKRDLLPVPSDADDKPSSEVSEQDYFDAQSHVSAHDSLDSVDKETTISPKIVDTVAKKLLEESVIEREIRIQREREAALAREREAALQRAATPVDDGFNSIPNTDEGNFSEYGSEDKDGSNSRVMSPEVPAQGLHQRTQSLDSMSSGHSSGSDYYPRSRRILVKPLDEPEDEELPPYMRVQKETPIEREIRLAKEREEELRREKGLPPLTSPTTPTGPKQEVRRLNSRNLMNTNDSRSVQHRLATSRIQQEINEATERERELRAAGMIQTTSEDTVDSKITRFTDLAEYAIAERDRKLQKSLSSVSISSPTNEADGGVITISSPSKTNGAPLAARTFVAKSTRPLIPSNSVKRFPTGGVQKGLMQRFFASHGKVNSINANKVPTPPKQLPVTPTHTPIFNPATIPRKPVELIPAVENQTSEFDEPIRAPARRGYQSAEEKIQVELQEMQKREEELRLQRAQMFAQSQPNLLLIGADDDDDGDNHVLNGDLDKPNMLRRGLSNPNLLDSEDGLPNSENDSAFDKISHRTARKKNALIAQWENRIQQNIEH